MTSLTDNYCSIEEAFNEINDLLLSLDYNKHLILILLSMSYATLGHQLIIFRKPNLKIDDK